VIIGFVATAWYTCLITCIAQFCVISSQIGAIPDTPSSPRETLLHWIALRRPCFAWLPSRVREFLHRNHSRLRTFAQILLDSLCDIQIVTGTAMLIAALVQIESITFYHEQLIYNYWSLTLNSFWAARAGDMDINARSESSTAGSVKPSIWHIRTRTFAIFCTVFISTVFTTLITLREKRRWDPFSSGYCFLTHDKSSPNAIWLWISGLALYSLYLVLYLATARDGRVGWIDEKFIQLKQNVRERYQNTITGCCPWFISYAPAIFLWLFLQFLAFWSYGDEESLLIVLAYIGVAAWSTYDIIDYKLYNKSLLEDSESAWGFGQVLPVVLLALIALSTFDAAESRCPFFPSLGFILGASY
jgi:hypothetical protein